MRFQHFFSQTCLETLRFAPSFTMPLAILSLALLAGSAFAQQTLWGQCGGIGWTGATNCVGGSCCSTQNPWYAQCTPGAGCPGGVSGTTSTTMTTRITTVPITTTTTTSAPTTSAVVVSGFQQVSSFGNNPTSIQMYIYVPAKLAANPAIIVAVSFHLPLTSRWAKC